MTQQQAEKIVSLGGLNSYHQRLMANKVKSVLYASLVGLRDGGKLVPGQWYRITDYVTTTTQVDTHVAGNQFDVIVRADSTNALNENAYAIKHTGDTYFTSANANLSAWELKYSLDNDKSKYWWADSENGKGVIWWMRDEWGNECPYDFKNIQFKRYRVTECEKVPYLEGLFARNDVDGITVDDSEAYWCYTFCMIDTSNGSAHDVSVEQDVYLNDEGYYCKTKNNVFKPYYMVEWDDDAEMYVNWMRLPDNVMVTDTEICYIEEGYGEFYGFYDNTFGNDCRNNTIGNGVYNNTIGNKFHDNSIGSSFISNSIGQLFRKNSIGDNFSYNFIGNDTYNNTMGDSVCCNTIGNGFSFNSIGNDVYTNTIGNNCNNIRILKDYVYYIIIENGNRCIDITSTQTTSSSNLLRNFTIAQGVNNSTVRKTISHNSVNDTFKTTYQSANSTTVNV